MVADAKPRLRQCLRQLHLSTMGEHVHVHAGLATNEGWPYDRYLLELCELELAERHRKKIERLMRISNLPREKTAESFDTNRIGLIVARKWEMLKTGEFLARKENVLAFGNPGGGKSHLICALGQELIKKGHSVLFMTCALLVQRLLKAKVDLKLAKELKTLDKYEAIIIDDLGYVQQNREEMEVLFTLLAHRYESRSVMITSNLVFSQWEKIFKDPMTTAAAIDRLVHHSVILELNIPSYRMEKAKTVEPILSEEEKAD